MSASAPSRRSAGAALRPDRGNGARAPGASLSSRLTRAAAVGALAVLAGAGCDDQVKYVDTFATMVEGDAVQTYEQPPEAPPENAVPVGARRSYGLLEADTALSSPLQPTPENVRAGKEQYEIFCLPCHGPGGKGDGPVINATGQFPQRLPPVPTADLTSERARGLSDGYIYGMIANGRGLMPSYERIPPRKRWQLVEYVRYLQRLPPDTAGSTAAERGRAR